MAKGKMTKRDVWLKLFQENDTALASAIHFCERFVTAEQLEKGKDFIEKKKQELYEEFPEDAIAKLFGEDFLFSIKNTEECSEGA